MQIVDHRIVPAHSLSSPNWNERPVDEISLIVVHGISLPIGHFGSDYVGQLFMNQLETSVHPDFADLVDLHVSSHLFIRRDGAIVQFVPFDKRAWHAGVSRFEGRENCNDFSIGIELEGTDTSDYREAQYVSLANACATIVEWYSIPPRHIVGHSDIAPGRKTDPGPAFDFARLMDMIEGMREKTAGAMTQ